jgi:phage recombination protein Bet
MSAIVQQKKESIPSLAISESELMDVLRNSLYPGAQDSSIKMVISYCKASGLDPMRKPVHIVPMWDSKTKSMRDVIMPGIGSYRSDAAKSGQYAGVSVAEFGPDITEKIGGVEITYPQWCRVVVKRQLANGQVAEFAATERWKENYAVKGGQEKSIAPNAMWQKRPYAQLEKCAEAQALRKAFPEVGSQPTADEMEGKPIYDGGAVIDNATGEILNKESPKPAEKPIYSDESFQKNKTAWREMVVSGKKSAEAIIKSVETKAVLTNEQRFEIDSWAHEND